MASSTPPHPPPPLPALLETHTASLLALYSALSPSPAPLLESDLDALRASLASVLAHQVAAAEAQVAQAEEKLAAAWRRVHDWQAALGEPLREAKKRGDGPLLLLVDEVEGIREGMKGRMEERGKRIVALHARLRELRETVGREWLAVELESEDKGWEEMDLRLDRMGELEREVMRCEAEIARRKTLLTEHCTEIFTLRTELGIHQLSSAPASPSSTSPSSDSLTAASASDPLDDEILWHLGVGEARQPRREIKPTQENVDRVAAKRQWLEDEKAARNTTIQTTYDKLYPLWTMLGVGEDEMEEFVNRHMGSTMDVVNAYQTELARMLHLKRQNLATFICRERAVLTTLWDALYLSHAQRLAQFPAYSISVEPTRVWNDKHGYEEEVVSENVSEELLVAHERERERVEGEVEEARPVLERLRRYFEVVEKGRELEAAAADPSRLMDKSRGAAMRLAQEAKDRKRVDKEKPKLEAELRTLIPQWEAAHGGRPFLVNGVSFIEGLDEQIRAEEMEKENRKRAKMGLSASSSGSSHSSLSSSSARPLRAQHTGASSLSSSHASHTVAPLKRQMTGASVRSTTSSSSHTSAAGPPAKRAAVGGGGAGGGGTTIARPRSRSVLREPNVSAGAGAATPAPLKAQATGTAGSRGRSGTLSASVAATPAHGGAAGSGMRIPVGWGASAAGGGGGGGHETPLATPSARLVPQPTGGFRPRAG
ncbi:hypothetical protein JCM8097_003044 [Rhodosporidiobolus ruineniae]